MMHPARSGKPYSASALVPLCGVVLLLGACGNGKPDDKELAQLVASILIDETAIESDRLLVIDHNSLTDLDPEIQAAITERLDKRYPGWQSEDVVGNFDAMPGRWETVEGLGRVNQTHLFITFGLEGAARERTLVYMRSYCALCGKGERIQLAWDGREWTRTTLSEILL